MKKKTSLALVIASLTLGLVAVATTLNKDVVAQADTLVEASGFSMPQHAPLYPALPYEYKDCDFTMVFTNSSSDLQALLPQPLVATNVPGLPLPFDVNLVLFEGNCSDSTVGSVAMAIAAVPVSLQGNFIGVFPLHSYTDNDAAVAARREIAGCPAKLADSITTKTNKGLTTVKMTADGEQLMKLAVPSTMPFPVEMFGPNGFYFPPLVSHKLIPSISGPGQYDVNKINWNSIDNQAASNFTWGGFEASPKVELGGPLGNLLVGPTFGLNYKFDFSIGYGQSLIDYLNM